MLFEFFLQVATSVAARGLDVKELILVVNYDCPNHYEDYVHRCGSVCSPAPYDAPLLFFPSKFFCTSRRTGRAGRHGYAYTFMTYEQARYAGDIVKALELSGANVPPEVANLWEEYKKQAEAVSAQIHVGST